MGVVIVENILRRLEAATPEERGPHLVYQATREVGGAVLTAVATTIISFLPVFTMEAAEGKLFQPLAFTKTFALISSIIVSLVFLPPIAEMILTSRARGPRFQSFLRVMMAVVAALTGYFVSWALGLFLAGWVVFRIYHGRFTESGQQKARRILNGSAVVIVGFVLTATWLPLGPAQGLPLNFIFVALTIGGILLFFKTFQWTYPRLLGWAMDNRPLFLCLPAGLLFFGALAWQGFDRVFFWLPESLRPAVLAETFHGWAASLCRRSTRVRSFICRRPRSTPLSTRC